MTCKKIPEPMSPCVLQMDDPRPTQEAIDKARIHLYMALVQSCDKDDKIIIEHMRDALALLGGPPGSK